MPSIRLELTEPAWPELRDKAVIHVKDPLRITGLVAGMASGAPSVAIRLDLPDGQIIVAETSLQLFLAAADALKAKYGDPRS
jgi:hypothetical protein